MANKIKEQDLNRVVVSSRETTTQAQLHSLLNIAGFMLSAIHARPPQPDGEYHPVLGEAPVAAENCFVKACEAIEAIVSDKQRWDYAFQKKVEDDYASAMQMNLEYIRAQRDAAVEAASPHHICNPNLALLQDGKYAAFTGSAENPNIYGLGSSPEEALAAFDDAFRGKVAETIQELNEQNKQVDGNGSDATQSPSQPGTDNEGDIQTDESLGQSGGTSGGPV
jgi:hypothetical protein